MPPCETEPGEGVDVYETHIPRLAWDAALAIVDASADPARVAWLADWLNTDAAQPYGQLLLECRN
ncbi:hypothetical protein ACFT9M_09380 [Micromonospora purpureochromogenes]|uniref:hypothetical protein n=1 Tax=Micromonospora purpureochromogenes TaxID=47872 RepID=UPI00363B61D6